MKVKKIRESLAKNWITDFDNLRDAQVLHNIHVNMDGEVFVKYEIFRKPAADSSVRKNPNGKKILNKMEKNLAALREMF